MRLSDEQLEALFCGHWEKTRDLVACLRVVIDAAKIGQPRALARAAADIRRARRPLVVSQMVDRAQSIQRAQPILHRFARAHGVSLRALFGRRGSRSVARVRYEAMWVLRQVAEMSYPEIGLAVGGRCHTDAIVGVRKTEARVAGDPRLRARLLAFARPARSRAA